MRKVLLYVLICAIIAPVVGARKPSNRAGTVEEGYFTDKKYNFKIKLNDGWKYKVQDFDENYRLTLTQVDYDIPADYMDAPDYTMIPRIAVFVDTTTMSVFEFVDSLLSDSYKSKQKKEIYKEFEILNNSSGGGLTREKLIPRQRRNLELAGERALLWTGRVKYRNEVAESASSIGAKRVYGGYEGGIVGVKKGNVIILFHTICEQDYFQNVFDQAMEMINTLQWTDK